jgi:hypothetical protein
VSGYWEDVARQLARFVMVAVLGVGLVFGGGSLLWWWLFEMDPPTPPQYRAERERLETAIDDVRFTEPIEIGVRIDACGVPGPFSKPEVCGYVGRAEFASTDQDALGAHLSGHGWFEHTLPGPRPDQRRWERRDGNTDLCVNTSVYSGVLRIELHEGIRCAEYRQYRMTTSTSTTTRSPGTTRTTG